MKQSNAVWFGNVAIKPLSDHDVKTQLRFSGRFYIYKTRHHKFTLQKTFQVNKMPFAGADVHGRGHVCKDSAVGVERAINDR